MRLRSGVAAGGGVIMAGGADDGGEQTQRIRPAAIGQAAGFHFLGQGVGLHRNCGHGAAQRLARQGELKIGGQFGPVSVHSSRSLFAILA